MEVARQRLEEYQRALQTRYSMPVSGTPPGVEPPRLIHTPLLNTWSARPPTALPLPTAPAALPCQASVKVPGIQPDQLPPLFHRFREGSTATRQEPVPIRGTDQRSESAWLTDSIMERVMKHLPERLRPVFATREPPRRSTSVPLQPTSDSLRAASPAITDAAALLPGHTAAKGGILPCGSVETESLSSSEVERQRWDLQQAQARVLEQREALALQRRQQEEERKRLEVEMEHLRRQKEAWLQAQMSEETIAASEDPLERGGHSSVTRRPQQDTVSPVHQSTSVTRQPISGSDQAVSRTVTDATPLVPSHPAVIGGTFTRVSLQTGPVHSTEHNTERQELQPEEEKKRVEVELEQMRRQKETLKALIDTEANVSEDTFIKINLL